MLLGAIDEKGDPAALAAELAELRDAVILCGAGMSTLSPSSVPSGPALLERAMRLLICSSLIRDELHRVLSHPYWQHVMPEVVLQSVLNHLGRLPAEIYSPLGAATPNRLHALLARAGTRGRLRVVTTNFDRLLTAANDQRYEPLHLHGRIDQPETMMHTIRRVGRGLSPEVATALRKALRGAQSLVVLGYSGNDGDVMHVLEGNPPAHGLWIVRSQDDRAIANSRRLRALMDLRVVVADLEEVTLAWDALEPAGWRAAAPVPTTSVEGDLRVDRALQAAILMSCWHILDEYVNSRDLGMRALRWRGLHPAHRVRLAWLTAYSLNRIGTFEEAERLMASALRTVELSAREQHQLARELGLAALDSHPPKWDQAKRYLTDAWMLAGVVAERTGETDLLGPAEHNLGYLATVRFLHGRTETLDKAAEHYRRALELKRRAGDLEYLQSSARNLAAVLRALACEDEAAAVYALFREIVESLGMRWDLAYYDALAGHLLMKSGRQGAAREHLLRARAAYEDLGNNEVMLAELDAILAEAEGVSGRSAPGSHVSGR